MCDQPQALQASSMWRTPSGPHLGPFGFSIQSVRVSGAERVSLGSGEGDAKPPFYSLLRAAPAAGGREAAAAMDLRKVRRVVMVVRWVFGVCGEVDFLFQNSLILERGCLRKLVNCSVDAVL